MDPTYDPFVGGNHIEKHRQSLNEQAREEMRQRIADKDRVLSARRSDS